MSFPFSVNKFLPINIKNTNAISGTYGGVSILNNGKTELVDDAVINTKLAIGKNVSTYQLDISGNLNVSGNYYVNGVLNAGTTGPIGPTGPPGVGGSVGYYGQFYSTTVQTATVNTATQIQFNISGLVNGMSLATNSIVLTNAGTYNIYINVAVSQTASPSNVQSWIRVNGSDLTNSTTQIVLAPISSNDNLTSTNIYTAAAGDILTFYWKHNLNGVIQPATSGSTPTTPTVSIIISQVVYTGPTGPIGPTGPTITDYVNLTTAQSIAGTKTFTNSPIIKDQYSNLSLFSNASTLTISTPIYPVYSLAPTATMTITLPTASMALDGAVILFFRVGGTSTVAINSASSNIRNNALAFTNQILTSKQFYRSIVCTANSGGYSWYYADNESILGTINIWTGQNAFDTSLPTSTLTPTFGNEFITKDYHDTIFTASNTYSGTNTYTVNPTFANNYALAIIDYSPENVAVSSNYTGLGLANTYIGIDSGAGNLGSFNTGCGYQTVSNPTPPNINLQGNSCFGYQSGNQFINGTSNNSCFGAYSGANAINGDSNCLYLGFESGSDGVSRHDNSTAIGLQSKVFGDNIIVIGGEDPGVRAFPMTYLMGGLNIPNANTLTATGVSTFNTLTTTGLGTFDTLTATGDATFDSSNCTIRSSWASGGLLGQLYRNISKILTPLDYDLTSQIFSFNDEANGGYLSIDYPNSLFTSQLNLNNFTYNIQCGENLTVIGNTTVGGTAVLKVPVCLSGAMIVPTPISLATTTSIGYNNLLACTSTAYASDLTAVGSGVLQVNASAATGIVAIGTQTFGQATNLGNNCVALGYRAGYNLTTSNSSSCTFLGANTGVSVAGTAYTGSSAIGNSAVITASNQCVIGSTSPATTVLINSILQIGNKFIERGSGTLITTTTTLSGVLFRYYSVTSAAAYSITLPAATVGYLGVSCTFRRVGATITNAVTSASANIFPLDSITAANTLLAASVCQVTICCMAISATPTYGWVVIA